MYLIKSAPVLKVTCGATKGVKILVLTLMVQFCLPLLAFSFLHLGVITLQKLQSRPTAAFKVCPGRSASRSVSVHPDGKTSV